VLYPKFTVLDIIGPFQVLVDVPGHDVVFVGAEAGPVIDHTGRCPLVASASFAEVPSPDVVVVPGGNSKDFTGPVASWLRRLVIVGGETDGRWLGGFDRQIRAHLLSLMVSQKLGTLTSSENSADLVELRELIESGKVIPVIDKTYPISEVPAAIRYVNHGHARGKVVISV
jgi:hypothetical protein